MYKELKINVMPSILNSANYSGRFRDFFHKYIGCSSLKNILPHLNIRNKTKKLKIKI
jgi:hypothetical protein